MSTAVETNNGWISSSDYAVAHRPTTSCGPRQGPIGSFDGAWTVHRTGGNIWGFWSRWQAGAGSAHFVIDLSGNITQCVSITQTAWHSGDWYWNQHSMSVELECGDADNNGPMTQAQEDALYWLMYAVSAASGVGIRSADIHRDHVQTTCPGDPAVAPLRALEAQIISANGWTRGVTVSSGAAGAPVPSQPVGARVLGSGDTGTDVAEWQTLLNATGASLVVDGDFGDATEAATRAFQAVAGVGADGLVGDRTRAAALTASHPAAPPTSAPAPVQQPVLALGSTGDAVEGWKRVLADAGLTVGDDPNTFGTVTDASTRQAQVWFGVTEDGLVGPDTRRALDTRTQFECRGLPLWTRSFSVGTSGDDVRAWQQRMEDRGWVIEVDGDFGQESAGVADQFAAEKNLLRGGSVDLAAFTMAWKAPVT